jgi:hypothetical protein
VGGTQCMEVGDTAHCEYDPEPCEWNSVRCVEDGMFVVCLQGHWGFGGQCGRGWKCDAAMMGTPCAPSDMGIPDTDGG